MPSIEISDTLYQKLQQEAARTNTDIETALDQMLTHAPPPQFGWDTVLRHVPVGCVIVDALQDDLPILYTNQAFTTITGYTLEEVIGKNCRFLQKEDRDQPGIKIIQQAIRTHTRCHTRLRNYHKDGSLFWNHVHIAPIRDAHGQVTHYLGIQQDITEMVLMADALNTSEARYRIIAELMTDYAYSVRVEPDGRMVNEWVTGAFEEITGLSTSGIGEEISFAAAHPEDLPRVLKELDVMLQNHPQTTEYRIKKAPDTTTWLRISRTPVWDEKEGRVVRFYGAVRNITAEKEAIMALVESEARFNQMANHAPVMIWMTDENGQCTYANQVWLDFRGRTFEEEIGLGWVQGIHPEDYEKYVELFRKVFTEHEDFQLEYRLRRYDGDFRWIRAEGVPRFTEDGKFLGYIGSSVDVTEIKQTQQELEARVQQQTAELRAEVTRRTQAEQELKRERDVLENMIRTSPSGILLMDLGGNIKFASKHVEQILGATQEQMRHHNYDTGNWRVLTLYGEALEGDQLPTNQVIKKRHPLLDQEVIIEREDASHIILSLNLAPILDDEGDVSEIVITMDDITLRKEWEMGLKTALENERQLNMLKSQFISTITHEFKTPMTVIRTSCHLLRTKFDMMTHEDFLKRLDRIDEQVSRLNTMVDDIVQLNRTGSYNYQPEWESIDLKQTIETIVEDVDTAYNNRVRVNTKVHMTATRCITDATLITQIITNLLTNAAKYSHDGGEVNLSCHCDEHTITLEVGDHGIGIPEADQPFLYNDFFRARNAESRPGIGFGLTIVRQAVRVLGGELNFESQENVGTTFKITLPNHQP